MPTGSLYTYRTCHDKPCATASAQMFMNTSCVVHAFTSNNTGNLYSAICLDHAHEQMNAQVKGDGGAIGLAEDPGALRRWMVTGPHLSIVITEYERTIDNSHVGTNQKHHEHSRTQQQAFWESIP